MVEYGLDLQFSDKSIKKKISLTVFILVLRKVPSEIYKSQITIEFYLYKISKQILTAL